MSAHDLGWFCAGIYASLMVFQIVMLILARRGGKR